MYENHHLHFICEFIMFKIKWATFIDQFGFLFSLNRILMRAYAIYEPKQEKKSLSENENAVVKDMGRRESESAEPRDLFACSPNIKLTIGFDSFHHMCN